MNLGLGSLTSLFPQATQADVATTNPATVDAAPAAAPVAPAVLIPVADDAVVATVAPQPEASADAAQQASAPHVIITEDLFAKLIKKQVTEEIAKQAEAFRRASEQPAPVATQDVPASTEVALEETEAAQAPVIAQPQQEANTAEVEAPRVFVVDGKKSEFVIKQTAADGESEVTAKKDDKKTKHAHKKHGKKRAHKKDDKTKHAHKKHAHKTHHHSSKHHHKHGAHK